MIKYYFLNIWDYDKVEKREKEKTEISVTGEISVIYIVTVVFATLVVSIVISSAAICIFLCCRRRSSARPSSCNTSDTSRDTDVTYYQVGHKIYASPVMNNKNVQNLSPQYLLRTWDETDILYQEDASQGTMVEEQFIRYPLWQEIRQKMIPSVEETLKLFIKNCTCTILR